MSRGLLKYCFKSGRAVQAAAAVLFCIQLFSCGRAEKELLAGEMHTRSEAQTMYELLQADIQLQENAVRAFAQSLSAEEKAAQLFLVNLEGKTDFSPVEYASDGKPLIPGGYLFFSYNIADSAAQIRRFTESIASYCSSRNMVPPLLTLDQEGGVVNRLRSVTSALPSARLIAERMPPEAAEALYAAQARQLAALGFHINLAPVAEVSDASNSQFLGTRSFGGTDAVRRYAAAAVRGYELNGVGTVLKHFPGNTNDDPHTGLPEIKLSAQEIETQCIDVFRSLLQCEPAGVLMSHARTAAYDSATPACLSPFWVTTMLRGTLGYDGLIFSDDIFMAALGKNGFPPSAAAVMTVEAGIDIIMLSGKRFAASVKILAEKASGDSSFAAKMDAALMRILRAKIQAGILILERSGDSYEVRISTSVPDLGSVPDLASVPDVSASSLSDFNTAFAEGSALYLSYFGGAK